MGPGWLGRLGVVYVRGANLFDTLMRNLMFLRDGGKLWEEDAPCWELDAARTEERTEVPCPDNFAGLMTMQYRRILLKRQEGWVTGCTVLGGDFFDSTNAFAEPMTLWNKKEESKNNPRYYYPRVHSMSKQLWREFSALTGIDSHVPGVIWWNTLLQNEKILSRKEHLQICALGVEYGKMSNSMTDCYTDQLSMELALLNELGRAWQSRVEDEVENCEQAAQCVGRLAWELSLAAGDKNDTTAESARTQFYFTIDQPFRLWLQSIDPETDKLDEKADEWQEKARKLAAELGRQMVERAGNAAFVGHRVEVKTGGKKDEKKTVLYTAPKAYNSFLYNLRKLYPKKEGGTA